MKEEPAETHVGGDRWSQDQGCRTMGLPRREESKQECLKGSRWL